MQDGYTKYLTAVEKYRENWPEYFSDFDLRWSEYRVLIVGPSGVGKDTLATLLAKLSSLRYCGSTSGGMIQHIYAVGREVGEIPEYGNLHLFYLNRHEHKQFFYDVCNAFRYFDVLTVPKQLCRLGANIVTGIRSKPELLAFGQLCGHILWVESGWTKNDPTLEYTFEDVFKAFPETTRCFWNTRDMRALLSRVVDELDRMHLPVDLSTRTLMGLCPSGLPQAADFVLTK